MSGGLEVASDRLLELMKKGVTVEQVARVTRAFTDAGVMVHAYLMYGFPTETEQETIDALERVRQLFAEGCIQSAFWHRFAATAHSPIGRDPTLFGIRLRAPSPPVDLRAQRAAVRGSRPAATTSAWGRACARRSTTTCTAWGSTRTCARWFDAGAPAARGRRRARVPAPKVPQESDPARAGGRSGVTDRGRRLSQRRPNPMPVPIKATQGRGQTGLR